MNPWHDLHTDIAKRAGKNPAKSAVARKILIAAWHLLSRQQPFKARRAAATKPCLRKLPLLSGRLTAPHGIEKPRQLPRTLCEAPSAEREMSQPHPPGARDPTATGRDHGTHNGARPP